MIADVKMLNFFRYIGADRTDRDRACWWWLSLFVQNFWCRYLCPYGALLGSRRCSARSRIRRE